MVRQKYYVGFHKNQAANAYVTDSGAGATAFAMGYKSFNGSIGIDANEFSYTSILQTAEKNEKAIRLWSRGRKIFGYISNQLIYDKKMKAFGFTER